MWYFYFLLNLIPICSIVLLGMVIPDCTMFDSANQMHFIHFTVGIPELEFTFILYSSNQLCRRYIFFMVSFFHLLVMIISLRPFFVIHQGLVSWRYLAFDRASFAGPWIRSTNSNCRFMVKKGQVCVRSLRKWRGDKARFRKDIYHNAISLILLLTMGFTILTELPLSRDFTCSFLALWSVTWKH